MRKEKDITQTTVVFIGARKIARINVSFTFLKKKILYKMFSAQSRFVSRILNSMTLEFMI